MKLAVHISTHCDGAAHLLHIGLFSENLFSLRVKEQDSVSGRGEGLKAEKYLTGTFRKPNQGCVS